MKKANFYLCAVCLLLVRTGAEADQLHVTYTPDFIKFYGEFREAVLLKNKSKIIEMTCFPFASHEVGEIFDERNIKIDKKTFVALDLHIYFLQDAAGEIFSSSLDPQPAHQIYSSSEDVIKKNADPANPLGITKNLSAWFKAGAHSADMGNLKFLEQKSKWCWSGADTSEPISKKMR